MPVKTALTNAEEHEQGIRRALLRRLATGLSVMASPAVWTCCWVSYTGPRGERWQWQSCTQADPPAIGTLPRLPDGRYAHCDHWHHRHEVFMA